MHVVGQAAILLLVSAAFQAQVKDLVLSLCQARQKTVVVRCIVSGKVQYSQDKFTIIAEI